MALLTGETRTASIIALTETVLYEITKDDFAPLFEEHPDLMQRMSDVLTQRTINRERHKILDQMSPPDEKTLSNQIFRKIQDFFARPSEQGYMLSEKENKNR